MEEKTCTLCNEIKSINDFRLCYSRNKHPYYRGKCRSCESLKQNVWRENNLEIAKDRCNKWRRNNPNYKAQYRVKNKEKINQYDREKYNSDPRIKLRKNISRAINAYLKQNNSNKNRESCLDFLSFSIVELKSHLESLFEPWMNWNNYGPYEVTMWNDSDSSTWTWQIDHIVPHSEFKYNSMEDDNFRLAWDLNNLRPLSAKENCLDGAYRTRHKKLT